MSNKGISLTPNPAQTRRLLHRLAFQPLTTLNASVSQRLSSALAISLPLNLLPTRLLHFIAGSLSSFSRVSYSVGFVMDSSRLPQTC
ncbi:hypothetical protein BLNAU_22322 [Blattamonas nauphoetae]|uniref:Uncharacterized protein n=1 Tax=Blattamonas nauphoetae TaxID=2049346 RepID=A0ABQ9WTF8_9EUKA|nr:hypothetical protein BLNAU_22322 [Blattamonas nauphoetae]